MRPPTIFLFLLPFLPAALTAPSTTPKPLPLVIWHGLGDSFDSDGIQSVSDLFNSIYPTTFVYPIRLSSSGSSDRSATFIGNINLQLQQVCSDLASIPELSAGFSAIGFSQGGQFLRGYVERCNSPPLKTLVTFGSQHNGISDFIAACEPGDWVCKSAQSLLRSSKWSPVVQERVIPAQYFRDPQDLETYLEHSAFLADVNNEREEKNDTYKMNLSSLERFVMFMFTEDRTVVPKESAWWGEVNVTSGEVVPLEERKLYTEDWLGLKKLGTEGRLEFLEIQGEHMRFSDEVLREVFEVYFGPKGKAGQWTPLHTQPDEL
ncbi:alpha/beta-hydrolase [Wilcoxina mikolae CBS 423.85]|nr:alpha/beta-hydrolase [Wilcoxina mikolae CBS 423.85]